MLQHVPHITRNIRSELSFAHVNYLVVSTPQIWRRNRSQQRGFGKLILFDCLSLLSVQSDVYFLSDDDKGKH